MEIMLRSRVRVLLDDDRADLAALKGAQYMTHSETDMDGVL